MSSPEKQQRRAENKRRRARVNELAEQGFNHSAIGRKVGIHRLTVKKWIEQSVVSTETATPDAVIALVTDGWNSIAEIQQTRELLWQHCFRFMRRPENLAPEEHEVIDKLLATPMKR